MTIRQEHCGQFYCPHVITTDPSGESRMEPCIGYRCMAWRWWGDASDEGGCGLIGKPELPDDK